MFRCGDIELPLVYQGESQKIYACNAKAKKRKKESLKTKTFMKTFKFRT